MIERPNRTTRFRTPPDLHSPNPRYSKPESDKPVLNVISIEKEKIQLILPRTIDDIEFLIKTNSNITEVRWIKYPDGFIHLVLYSASPDPRGYGGLCMNEKNFNEIMIRLKKYPHIKIINGSGMK